MKKNTNDYWMYSKHSIETALQNPDRQVKELLVEKKFEFFYRKFVKENNIFKKKIKFKITNKLTISKRIGKLAKYQGVALLVEKIDINKKLPNNDNILQESFILMIDQLNDPNNLGSLLRVSYAFGVKSVIIPERSMPEENGFVASMASGALDKIKIFKVKNLINAIDYLKKNNWWIIGLESKELNKCIDLKQKTQDFEKKVLVIGSEKNGIRQLVRKNCDILFRIPTKNNDLDSINVVQAASIGLYVLF